MKVSDLKKKLRQLGVEPDDYPGITDKSQLVNLYREKVGASLTKEKNELQRQKELMAMPVAVRVAVVVVK